MRGYIVAVMLVTGCASHEPSPSSMKDEVTTQSASLAPGRVPPPVRAKLYEGPCACPDDRFVRKGRLVRCGKLSAFVPSGGKEPMCPSRLLR